MQTPSPLHVILRVMHVNETSRHSLKANCLRSNVVRVVHFLGVVQGEVYHCEQFFLGVNFLFLM